MQQKPFVVVLIQKTIMDPIQLIKLRTFRLHLAIIGYLAYSASTIYWGQRPWDQCVDLDKTISVLSILFIIQNWFNDTTLVDNKLKKVQLFAALVFIYIHFIK